MFICDIPNTLFLSSKELQKYNIVLLTGAQK